jgi:hypothetical protein
LTVAAGAAALGAGWDPVAVDGAAALAPGAPDAGAGVAPLLQAPKTTAATAVSARPRFLYMDSSCLGPAA